jgi:hypothetical protein
MSLASTDLNSPAPVLLPPGDLVAYAVTLKASGNTKLVSMQVSLQGVATSAAGTGPAISCAAASGSNVALPTTLPAGAALVCSFNHLITQDMLESGALTPSVSVSATNMEAPRTVSLTAITSSAAPAVSLSLEPKLCKPPTQAGVCTTSCALRGHAGHLHCLCTLGMTAGTCNQARFLNTHGM